jgi:hypothetical protein
VNGASVFCNSTALTLGWTAGARLETAVGNDWSVKFEYLASTSDTSRCAGWCRSDYANRNTNNIVRVAVNCGFGGPIVRMLTRKIVVGTTRKILDSALRLDASNFERTSQHVLVRFCPGNARFLLDGLGVLDHSGDKLS